MEAVVPVFIAILLAELGGKVSRFTEAQARSADVPERVWLPLITASLLGMAIATLAGLTVAHILGHRAGTMLVGLALMFAAIPEFRLGKAKSAPPVKDDFVGRLAQIGTNQFGDNAQFLAFAFSAHTELPVLVAGSGLFAILAAHLPVILDPHGWRARMRLSVIGPVARVLLLLVGIYATLFAMELI